ncbi:Hemagluttinin repeat family protein [Mycena venus]|uniref:Hemagluttinin repeat family protein n=1 Tax=Mycena venus TaxID=2733690 RepID=A0A8H6YQK8_9AGAR|nr:Hemagluttinin repeat family protein [Mycena venus]
MLFSLVYVAVSVASLVPAVAGVPVCRKCPATKHDDGPEYVCEDKRLGPVVLSTRTPELKLLLANYDPLGGLCPEEWLMKYTYTNGSIHYPDGNGFELSAAGTPIKENKVLPAGTLLDRFGRETGSYLSPLHTPANQRSLAPSSFDPPAEYHVYKVLTELAVEEGKTAPWFGQPGLGIQYHLSVGVSTLLGKNLTEISEEPI